MSIESKFMLRCIELGKESMRYGNSPVGAVLVIDGQIVGEGLELAKSKNDITYHAEIEAIRDALQKLNVTKLYNTTLYTTHEPCLMCSYSIRHYGIEKVVYGIPVSEIGGHSSSFKLLETKEVSNWSVFPGIISGFMKRECELLHQEYLNLKMHQ